MDRIGIDRAAAHLVVMSDTLHQHTVQPLRWGRDTEPTNVVNLAAGFGHPTLAGSVAELRTGEKAHRSSRTIALRGRDLGKGGRPANCQS